MIDSRRKRKGQMLKKEIKYESQEDRQKKKGKRE